jgi:hypothetical protein
MTQKSLIDLIFETVNDGLDEHKRHEDIKKNIEILLVDVLKPIDACFCIFRELDNE